MASEIEAVEWIGPVYAQKLVAAGVKADADMLILKWANHVGLMRISGVGPQYAELLEASGVDTVKELAQRNAANLARKLGEVNTQKKLAGTTPAESQVADWIGQARKLDPKISY